MIQRIQSVYIILGTLFLLLAFLYFPYYKCINTVESLHLLNSSYSLIFFLFFFLLALFSFTRRMIQIQFIYGLILLSSLIIIYNLYMLYESGDLFTVLDECSLNVYILPLLLLGKFFYYLSIRAIKKDQDLLDSINRLR